LSRLFSLGHPFGASSEHAIPGALIARPARQIIEIIDPRHRGSAPDLPLWLQMIALTDATPANTPIIGSGEKWRTALAAKMLEPSTAIISNLGIDLRGFARHPELIDRTDYGHPVGLAGQALTIRAVTDRYFVRIDVSLIGHLTAMALPVDFHRPQLHGFRT
jgi:hypothetical protein